MNPTHMGEAEFRAAALSNPVNAALLERLGELAVPQLLLVAGCLFQTVWNARSNRPPAEGLRDYDIFYWDEDTSYEAEDAVIRRAEALYADLGVLIEVRNQARVHLWFGEKYGHPRPPIRSAKEGVEQFLVLCTCVGMDAGGGVYAPYGFDDLSAGILRPNPLNHTPELYAAKVSDYQRRWPWLRLAES